MPGPRAHFDTLLMEDPWALTADMVAHVFPELHRIVSFGGGSSGHKALWPHTLQVVHQCPKSLMVRWAALFHDVGKPDCLVYRGSEVQFHGHEIRSAQLFHQAATRTGLFSDTDRYHIGFLVENLGLFEEYDTGWTDSAVRRLSRTAGVFFHDLVDLATADITTKHQSKHAAHKVRMQSLRDRAVELARLDAIPPALVTGLGTVLEAEFGVKGKALGDLMKVAREAVEAGKLARQAPPDVVVEYLRSNTGAVKSA